MNYVRNAVTMFLHIIISHVLIVEERKYLLLAINVDMLVVLSTKMAKI